MPKRLPAIVAVVGRSSNSGKTVLITQLLPVFKAKGYRVAALKHAGHGFEMDKPGKDTHKYKEAGADAVAAVSQGRLALIRDIEEEQGPIAIAEAFLPDMDLVLVEGFKKEILPKIEVLGDGEDGGPLLSESDPNVIASMGPFTKKQGQAPAFSQEDVERLAAMIEERFLLPARQPG